MNAATAVNDAWVHYTYQFHDTAVAGSTSSWGSVSTADQENGIIAQETHYADGSGAHLSVGDTFLVNSIAALPPQSTIH